MHHTLQHFKRVYFSVSHYPILLNTWFVATALGPTTRSQTGFGHRSEHVYPQTGKLMIFYGFSCKLFHQLLKLYYASEGHIQADMPNRVPDKSW